jgi:hypothetical protein
MANHTMPNVMTANLSDVIFFMFSLPPIDLMNLTFSYQPPAHVVRKADARLA